MRWFAFYSVLKALLHASVECSRKLCIEWVAATDLEDETRDEVRYLEWERSALKVTSTVW